ncbi:hypothetical protein EAE96_001785 [Botrytis aclada]|nr:hypothetical protein EAE96_001785 [Botrytis aclada]
MGYFSTFKNLERISLCIEEKNQDLSDELVIQKQKPKDPTSLKNKSLQYIDTFCGLHDGVFFVKERVLYRYGDWGSRAWIGFSEGELFGRNKLWLQAKSEEENWPTDGLEEYLSRIKFDLHVVKERSSKDLTKQVVNEDDEEYRELNSGDSDEDTAESILIHFDARVVNMFLAGGI